VSKSSAAEDLFMAKVLEAGLPVPETEVTVLPPRKWRVDFCWTQQELVVEIDGGGWVGGRHHRPAGYDNDAEKLNAIAAAGYCVFRFTPKMVRSGLAIRTVQEYFERWYAYQGATDDHDQQIQAKANYNAEMGLSGDE